MQQPINTDKAVPVHMKACMGGVGIAPLILNLGTIWRDIMPRERASGTYWIGGWLGPATLDNLESIRPTALAPAGIRIPDHSACSLITILTINPSTHSFIYWLIYSSHNDVGKRSDYTHVVSNGWIIGLVNSALAGILEWMWPNLRFKTGIFLTRLR